MIADRDRKDPWGLKRSNLYEQIADALERSILSSGEDGLLPPGQEKLPSEQTLAEKFGVSRPVVREGLKLVKERGLIEQRSGGGSYITSPRPKAISAVVGRMIQMENLSDDDIHGVRVILEVGACRMAAANATAEGKIRLAALLSNMAQSQADTERLVNLDADFHNEIAHASGNRLLRILIEANLDILRVYMAKGVQAPGAKADGLMHHTAIYEAIAKADPDEAEAAMRTHLEVSRQHVAFVTGGEGRLARTSPVPKG